MTTTMFCSADDEEEASLLSNTFIRTQVAFRLDSSAQPRPCNLVPHFHSLPTAIAFSFLRFPQTPCRRAGRGNKTLEIERLPMPRSFPQGPTPTTEATART